MKATQEAGYIYPLETVETFNIGAYYCPSCDATDRERLYALYLDEIMAGVGLVAWIIVDRISDAAFGGATPDLAKIWGVRGALVVVLAIAYIAARKRWHVAKAEA